MMLPPLSTKIDRAGRQQKKRPKQVEWISPRCQRPLPNHFASDRALPPYTMSEGLAGRLSPASKPAETLLLRGISYRESIPEEMDPGK